MSDYKVSETITNALKNTKYFEKIDKIKFYVGTIVIVTSIIGLSNICSNYYTCCRIKQLEDKMDTSHREKSKGKEKEKDKDKEKEKEKDKEKEKEDIIANLVKLEKKINISIDARNKLTEKIIEIKLLLLNMNSHSIQNIISRNVSSTSFSPMKPEELLIDTTFCHDDDVDDDYDYDELQHECYDVIPLNNLKKNTALSWLYNIM
jgi:hypothetical protein